MQNDTEPMTSAEMVQENDGRQKTQDETAKALQREKVRKRFWKYLTIAIVCICLYKTKSNIVWLPVADSPQVCVIMSNWWGLKVQTVYPVWRKPTGETAEYSEKWCIQYPDNTWRVFYSNNGGSFSYA